MNSLAEMGVPAGPFTPQYVPSLEGIVTLFSRFITAASLWVHLVAINTFAATRTFLQGMTLPLLGRARLFGDARSSAQQPWVMGPQHHTQDWWWDGSPAVP